MGYDWEKIFKDKTNKELYDIVTGKKVLSKEAIKYAKSELENRNFDFNNMEANIAAWEISDIIEEEDYVRLEITGRRARHISLNILSLIILGIVIVYFVLNEMPEYNFPLGAAAFFAGMATLFVLLNNFQAKRQAQNQNKRMQRIRELTEKLDNENLLSKDSPIQKEIIKHRIKEAKDIKTLSFLIMIISAISLLIYILYNLL